MSSLRGALGDYVRVRRALGFVFEREVPELERFVGFLEQAGAQRITIELALRWARMPQGVHPYVWRKRLGIVRGFARYLATIDPASEIPPTDLLPARQPRLVPHIYTPEEIVALMMAARSLPWPLRAATCETVIGLLASTGLRLREALALDRSDVELEHGVLLVRGARHHKQREVPLHPSTTAALQRYVAQRDRLCPDRVTPAFFLTNHNRRLTPVNFRQAFPKLIAQAGLKGRGQRPRPRPHDLRHTFAVRTLLGWYHTGQDIDRNLPLLSTYLGHVELESTYWYLQSVPELIAQVSSRLDQRLPEGLS